MDMIHLLEVLKPASDVMTVQITNDKNGWDLFSDLLKVILPAAATAGVAWIAMNKSHRQFEKMSERQAEEFRTGIRQQTRTLMIHTQLATEVELNKEICRSLREVCGQYLSLALEARQYYSKSKIADMAVQNGDESKVTQRDSYQEKFLETWQKTSSAKIVLMSFLDPSLDEHFFESVVQVEELLFGEDVEFGASVGSCMAECRHYIDLKHKEIMKLHKTIAEGQGS